MNNKQKGIRNERRSKKLLEDLGFKVFRSAASLGVFDLIAISSEKILLIQVKTNQSPCPAEIEEIKKFSAPIISQKLIHLWKDRTRLPIVNEVI